MDWVIHILNLIYYEMGVPLWLQKEIFVWVVVLDFMFAVCSIRSFYCLSEEKIIPKYIWHDNKFLSLDDTKHATAGEHIFTEQ